MSHYSEQEYRVRTSDKDLWLDRINYQRFFAGIEGRKLDIGCATGNFITNDPEHMEGIDIDQDSLEIARSRGFTVQHLNASTQLSSLPANTYHGIYAKHVIEHLEQPLEFLKQVRRILAPGGKVVISTPNCPYALTRMFYDDYTHVRPLTARSLCMIARDAGFTTFTITEDFRCFPGLGRLMRTFSLKPDQVRAAQNILRIRGLSLILQAWKP